MCVNDICKLSKNEFSALIGNGLERGFGVDCHSTGDCGIILVFMVTEMCCEASDCIINEPLGFNA